MVVEPGKLRASDRASAPRRVLNAAVARAMLELAPKEPELYRRESWPSRL